MCWNYEFLRIIRIILDASNREIKTLRKLPVILETVKIYVYKYWCIQYLGCLYLSHGNSEYFFLQIFIEHFKLSSVDDCDIESEVSETRPCFCSKTKYP